MDKTTSERYNRATMNWLHSVFLLLLFALPVLASGQEPINENPLTIVSVQTEKDELTPGASTGVTLLLDLAKGHHAYVDQFKLIPISPKQLNIGSLSLSPIVEFYDQVTKKNKEGVKGESTLSSVIELPLDFPANVTKVTMQLRYQACTVEYCLFPKKLKFELPLSVSGGTGAVVQSGSPPKENGKVGFFEVDFSSGNWGWIFFVVFIAGFLTSFTPCIFPMIPITLTVLGAKGKEQTHFKGFLTSIFYVLGIATTYSILGVVAASTGSLFGSLLGHPVVIGLLAALFAAMSLSMLGFFELKAPSSISQKLSGVGGGGGFGGAYVIGAAAGIVASPCVGPVLVTILAYVAKTQQLLLGFGLLFTFAIGMGLIFIALGTFSQLIQKLPKSGNWMDGVKYVFSIVMMALAIYYLDPLLSPMAFNVISILALLAFALYFLLRTNLVFIRLVGLFLLALAFTIAGGSFTKDAGKFGTVLNPSSGKEAQGHDFWEVFNAKVIAEAEANGDLVVVDFAADWCAACKELETFTFADPMVQTLAKEMGVRWMQYDATDTNDEFQGYKETYEILGLPTVLLFDSTGLRDDLRLTGFENAEKFMERLKKLKQ